MSVWDEPVIRQASATKISKLRLPRRSQYSFQCLRHPVRDQIRILFRDVVCRREDEKIAIGTICYSASRDDRDADFRRETPGMDRGRNLLAGWERLFSLLVLDKLNLELLLACLRVVNMH